MIAKPTLGFIGVRVMGEKMCRNLAQKSGRPIFAFDQNTAPLERLSADGVKAAVLLISITTQTDIIFMSLPGELQVREVVLDDNGLLARARTGQIIVDCSKCPVRLAQEIAKVAAAKGVHFLDAPVAHGVKAAEDGSLNFMVGGDQKDFDTVLPYIKCTGGDITLCGPPGAGQALKLMNNMIVVQTV